MSRFILSPHKQGTSEWKFDRAGKATGSKGTAILAKLKSGGEAATRKDYKVQLVVERLMGAPVEEGFVSKDMQHGTEVEPFGRMAFEVATGKVVEEAGFAYLPDVAAGCSVDGFIDNRRGLLEIKCPKTATHVDYLLADRLPPEYEPQINHNLWVTGCAFAYFVSYDDRLPEEYRLLVIRVQRDDAKIKAHEAEVLKFLAEVDELEAQLRAKQRPALAEAA
jgi:predicted phage-related endonuclease